MKLVVRLLLKTKKRDKGWPASSYNKQHWRGSFRLHTYVVGSVWVRARAVFLRNRFDTFPALGWFSCLRFSAPFSLCVRFVIIWLWLASNTTPINLTPIRGHACVDGWVHAPSSFLCVCWLVRGGFCEWKCTDVRPRSMVLNFPRHVRLLSHLVLYFCSQLNNKNTDFNYQFSLQVLQSTYRRQTDTLLLYLNQTSKCQWVQTTTVAAAVADQQVVLRRR